MERIGNKVSYIKKPFARYGFVSLGLSLAALCFTAGAIFLGYLTQGGAPLSAGAVGLSGILFDLAAIVYGILAFFEKEKNHLIAKVSFLAAGVILFVWVVMIIVAV